MSTVTNKQAKITQAIKHIKKICKPRHNGYMDCPVCNEVDFLRFSRAPNGDVHAYCRTKKCFAFME